MPIRKVSAFRAALTSYYGKLFIQRSQLAKSNFTRWVYQNINKAGLDSTDNRIQNIRFGSNAIPKEPLPRAYTAVMTEISEFKSKGVTYFFETKKREEFFGDAIKKFEKKGFVLVGKKGSDFYLMDYENVIHKTEGKTLVPVGSFMEAIGGGWGKVPREFAEIANLKGKRAPIGIILGYHYGLSKLLRKLNIKSRTEPANIRSTETVDEMSFTFADQRLLIKTSSKKNALIMGGFTTIEDSLKGYNLSDLNKKDVFGPLLRTIGLEKYHINEVDLIQEMFVDPITEEVLVDMKEPTDILELYERCVELVTSDEHPDETDPNFMRERRLERIPGFLYSTMIKAIREQRNKPNPSIHPVYMGPRDVWSAVTSDTTSQLVKELNPVHALKQLESVSLSGEGGRAAETLVKSSRVFHKNDVGRYSADTPDSGKVGIRTFTPPNPTIKGIRGTHGDFDFKRDGSTSVISTTGLLLPAMHNDDQKLMHLD